MAGQKESCETSLVDNGTGAAFTTYVGEVWVHFPLHLPLFVWLKLENWTGHLHIVKLSSRFTWS
jgi:hypothetical protein